MPSVFFQLPRLAHYAAQFADGHLHGLANAIASEGLQVEQSLRLISAGGEKMLADRLAVWRRAAPHLRLINSYGPDRDHRLGNSVGSATRL